MKASATSSLAVRLSASGPCAVRAEKVHLTGVGWCTITASQDGNAEFNPAQPLTHQFHIGKARAAADTSEAPSSDSTKGRSARAALRLADTVVYAPARPATSVASPDS